MKTTLLSLVAGIGLLLAGCGGSSSSAGSTETPATQVFATDDLNSGFDHVWVTIDKVDLIGASGTTNLYDDTANGGKVVDLRTLRDSTGAKFLLLGGCNTPPGTFTGVTVTVASALNIVSAGSKTSTAATFSTSSGSTFALSLTFATPQMISATNRVVVDFDLANWVLTGTSVSATNNQFLTQGPTTGLGDGTRQCSSDYVGSVSGLTGTAPSQTFSLTQGKNSINVAMSSTTTIVNSDGSSNAALANAEHVLVSGTFDPAGSVLDATSITIQTGKVKPPADHVMGLVTAFDATAGTLTVQIQGCDGFQPSATTVAVSVSPTTMYFDGWGVTDTQSQFFAALVANTSLVFADGTLSGSALTASDVAISIPPTSGSGGGLDNPGGPNVPVGGNGPNNPPRHIAIQGVASNSIPTAGTFDVTIANWEGIPIPKGGVVHVVTSSTTQFTNVGAAQTQAGFFTAITSTTQVQVRGAFDPSTMTLTATQVNSGTGGQFHF